MYPNLRAEMARKMLTVSNLATVTGRSEKSIREKLSGKTDFTISESLAIQKNCFPGFTLDYLFAKEEAICPT